MAMWLRRLGQIAALLLGWALWAHTTTVSAQSSGQPNLAPIILVLESEDPRVQAPTVRRALSEAGLPAISLLDARARHARGTMTVAVARDGHTAQVHFSPRHAPAWAVFLRAGRRADRRGRWMVPALVTLVQSRRAQDPLRFAVSSEVLDPWQSTRRVDPTVVQVHRVPNVEVIDPWRHEPRTLVAQVNPRTYRMSAEVLDPWTSGHTRPATPPQIEAVTSEVVDPWNPEQVERARGLTRPQPGERRPRRVRRRRQR